MHNRREDSGCCSRLFLKSMMVVFNIFFWLSGLVFLLIGLGSLFLRHHYISLLDSLLFPLTTYLFLAIGGVIIIMGTVGCVGTLRELRCCLIFYAFMLMLIFLLETCSGVVAYMYENAIHEEISRNLNQTISSQYDRDPEVTRAVDHMQTSFQCCGGGGVSDWQSYRSMLNGNGAVSLVPTSCCIVQNETCTHHLSNVRQEGCAERLEKFTRCHLIFIGGVALGLSILQVFGIIFACCLAQKVKKEVDL